MATRLIAQRACNTLLPRNHLITPNAAAVRSATAASLSRSFNTDTSTSQVSNVRNDDQSGSVAIDRRRSSSVPRRLDASPSLLSDWIDPFSPTRTLSQVFNLMDQFMDPFLSATPARGAPATRRGWDVKEDESKLYMRMDMPGLSKEDVNVCVEHNTLVIKGEGGKESEEDEDGGRKYSSRIELPPHLYKLDEIKGEMKNGVLKIVVPKVKEEERKNVKEIPLE